LPATVYAVLVTERDPTPRVGSTDFAASVGIAAHDGFSGYRKIEKGASDEQRGDARWDGD
jgi:hypothetical protein